MWVNGASLKKYCVFCLKIYNTLRGCRNFPAGSRQAASGARICETNLLGDILRLGYLNSSNVHNAHPYRFQWHMIE